MHHNLRQLLRACSALAEHIGYGTPHTQGGAQALDLGYFFLGVEGLKKIDGNGDGALVELGAFNMRL